MKPNRPNVLILHLVVFVLCTCACTCVANVSDVCVVDWLVVGDIPDEIDATNATLDGKLSLYPPTYEPSPPLYLVTYARCCCVYAELDASLAELDDEWGV